jgi:hypothetical protein
MEQPASHDSQNEFEEHFEPQTDCTTKHEPLDCIKDAPMDAQPQGTPGADSDAYFSLAADQELLDFIEVILHDNLEQIEAQISTGSPTGSATSMKELPEAIRSEMKERIRKTRHDFQLSGLILEKMQTYNALTDKHLQAFLSQKNRKLVLQQNGLMDDEGFIVTKPLEYLREKQGDASQSGTQEKSSFVSMIKVPEKGTKSPYVDTAWALRDKLTKTVFARKAVEKKYKAVKSKFMEGVTQKGTKKEDTEAKKEIKPAWGASSRMAPKNSGDKAKENTKILKPTLVSQKSVKQTANLANTGTGTKAGLSVKEGPMKVGKVELMAETPAGKDLETQVAKGPAEFKETNEQVELTEFTEEAIKDSDFEEEFHEDGDFTEAPEEEQEAVPSSAENTHRPENEPGLIEQ